MLAHEIVKREWLGKTDSKGTPYIVHVDMGCAWLRENYPEHPELEDMVDAFCLHPLVQDFKGLQKWIKELSRFKTLAYPLALAIEYRNQANWYGTWNYLDTLNKPNKVMLEEVRIMLKADKVQNFWNFSNFRQDHPKYQTHCKYFADWFEALDITQQDYLDASDLFDKMWREL